MAARRRLPDRVVCDIRWSYESGARLSELARKHGLSEVSIWAILIGRTYGRVPGTAHLRGSGNAKLNPAAVRAIRTYRTQGETIRVIASRFGVSHRCIMDVLSGSSWRHVA